MDIDIGMEIYVLEWNQKVKRSRGILEMLSQELILISETFNNIVEKKLDLYQLDKANTDEYLYESGKLEEINSSAIRNHKNDREELANNIKTLEDSIKRTVDSRNEMMASEVRDMRSQTQKTCP
ncbi:hypothetical protein OS493_000365 [Desmophyllum pertusum]|uniref:Uncharacterized protein n=1 Tax=Desmophyllum pertusum TaxID=174260 RepID=A0A9X0A7R4_9CNID|nr:hypothetical protein OS493_000365 [Desmophyllum pertusum]